ncbi:hypothetical protein DAPPUDRAFT_332578 [Daphnia pulex]|uniref:Uncharacterized protein n=1 Tax=Daphnia pulex TaxID=6669 RepID=E9HQB7_DAPPU|nr:hypothetical protein DAPPUDRAFT_332578 [Daphnia pulex]|eukprot:EFX66059.1 hypothetical protein DAPPUDRAFT_332578 [Daphnia pulex]
MVNLLDNNGNTPAYYVSDIPTLKILIANKARMYVVNKFDNTPMMTAAKEQRNRIFQYIRLYNIKQQEKQTPVVTVSKPSFHDRFGIYYRERIRQITESLMAKGALTPDEDLPELPCKMPPLEELEITNYDSVEYLLRARKLQWKPQQPEKILLHLKQLGLHQLQAVRTE